MTTCTTPGCKRYAMRNRNGVPCCLYCPDTLAPPMDLNTGKLREGCTVTPLYIAGDVRPTVKTVAPRVRKAPAARSVRPVKAVAPCTIDGCAKPVRARGMCGAHYTASNRPAAPPLLPCGTTAARERHRAAGEPACAECKAAEQQRDRERYLRKRR